MHRSTSHPSPHLTDKFHLNSLLSAKWTAQSRAPPHLSRKRSRMCTHAGRVVPGATSVHPHAPVPVPVQAVLTRCTSVVAENEALLKENQSLREHLMLAHAGAPKQCAHKRCVGAPQTASCKRRACLHCLGCHGPVRRPNTPSLEVRLACTSSEGWAGDVLGACVEAGFQ